MNGSGKSSVETPSVIQEVDEKNHCLAPYQVGKY